MKNTAVILLLFLLALTACDKTHIEKPDHLIHKKQMIDMLVDVHMAEASFNSRRYEDDRLKSSSSVNFYHSVLTKYQVPDSLFEKSFVFYASKPKEFEKMYREVMNRLNELEQEYSGRKNELLEFEDKE